MRCVLSPANAISNESRPDEHQKGSNKQTGIIQSAEPTVPLSLYRTTQTALNDALLSLHAEQEARAKDQTPGYEPIYAPSVLVQFGLFVIGFFYTLYARRQWFAITEQTRLIEETLVADKRAFITADTFWQFWVLDTNNGSYHWRLTPRYRNTGGTPTKNLRSQVHCEVRNEVLPDNYAFACDERAYGTGVIGPQSETRGGTAPQGAPITPQDIIDAQNGRKFIYLWGRIEYFDIFPRTPLHTTHFCWLIQSLGDPMRYDPDVQGQPPTQGTMRWDLVQISQGNYAD
jgi:hypothetical protein